MDNYEKKYHDMLFSGMFRALQFYSNVHRGSGHRSIISTDLFERAREAVLDFLELDAESWCVVFGSSGSLHIILHKVPEKDRRSLTSAEFNLPFGVYAIAIRRKAIPSGIPYYTGGGTTRLYSRKWVLWNGFPDLLEAGTPAIINVIGFARALIMIKLRGPDIFRCQDDHQPMDTSFLHKEVFEGKRGFPLMLSLRETMPGKDQRVPVIAGDAPVIHFDHSASTSAFMPSWEAFTTASLTCQGNRREIVEEVRSITSRFLDAPDKEYEVMFTSGATESINILARQLAGFWKAEGPTVVMTTILEHSSNDLPWRYADGLNLIRAAVDKQGFWDLVQIEEILKSYNQDHRFGEQRIRLVAVAAASNVLGSCNDLKALANVVHKYGAYLMVDAAQLVAHREISMKACNIDFLAFSAHKIYAPFGSGVLVMSRKISAEHRESLTDKCRAGEDNVAGIAALGRSLVLMDRIGFDVIREHEQELTRNALQGLAKINGVRIYGLSDVDSPEMQKRLGVIVISINNKMPAKVARSLFQNCAIATRYGCHCAHLIIKYLSNFNSFGETMQKIIVQMFPKLNLQGLLRISFGIENSKGEVDLFINELSRITNRKGKSVGSHSASFEGANKSESPIGVKTRIDVLRGSIRDEVYNIP